jgi:phosphoserine phosphatase
MTSASLVATLVAPAGAALSDSDISLVETLIRTSGGKLEGRIRLSNACAVDLFFTGPFFDTNSFQFDVLVQPAANRRKKILLADMESTIIQEEMLDEMAVLIGIGPETAEITRRAMNGELDFAAALHARVALLKGQPENLLREAAAKMTLSPGATELVGAMKKAGAKCWLVSGGFSFFVKIIAERLGFDRYYANDLLLEDGVLTGKVADPILDKHAKKRLLLEACATYGCSLADTLTVGDGANDVPMLDAAGQGGGLGVAYRAKPKVRELIHSQINKSDLCALVYAQGLST